MKATLLIIGTLLFSACSQNTAEKEKANSIKEADSIFNVQKTKQEITNKDLNDKNKQDSINENVKSNK